MLKLPRQLEADPRHELVKEALNKDLRPLWERGSIQVVQITLSEELEKALRHAHLLKQLERGLEHIQEILAAEEKGLAALREKQQTVSPQRISRLLLILDDGSERFYRQCESVLSRFSDRVLGLRINSSAELAKALFGEDALLKAMLVADRDAVSNILLSVVK